MATVELTITQWEEIRLQAAIEELVMFRKSWEPAFKKRQQMLVLEKQIMELLRGAPSLGMTCEVIAASVNCHPDLALLVLDILRDKSKVIKRLSRAGEVLWLETDFIYRR
jgi:hypothetical protein